MKRYTLLFLSLIGGVLMLFAAGNNRKVYTPKHHINIVRTSELAKQTTNTSTANNNEIALLEEPSMVDLNVPMSAATNDYTFAVVIGNELYKQVAQVPFAVNDCRVFAEYCEKTLGIPSANIRKVENATLNDIRAAVSWISQVMEAYNGDARVIFYYAGHGIPDESTKTAYLLPVDGYGTNVQTGYKLDDLYAALTAHPTRSVTVFLDACFSGTKREDGMLASARGVAIKVKEAEPQGNMVVFSAAKGDETAYPNRKEGHGMFTYYLLEKLQISNGDVYLGELSSYVTDHVRRQSIVENGKSQTPTIMSSSAVSNDWVFWKLKH